MRDFCRDGSLVPLDDLLAYVRSLDAAKYDSEGLLPSLGTFEFDPLCRTRTSRWERAVRSVIYAVSGQLASRGEILRGQMFAKALREGRVPDLLLTLAAQFHQVETFLAEHSTDSVRHSLVDLDAFAREVEDSVAAGTEALPLRTIAETLARPAVERLMNGRDLGRTGLCDRSLDIRGNESRARELEGIGWELPGGTSLAEATRSVIDWFFTRASNDSIAKATYETYFYAMWGRRCAEQGEIAIGLDRDFDHYQIQAWNVGWERGRGAASINPSGPGPTGAPLLYARRTPKEREGGILGQISFRQFWREIP
jgi:hypothetical protein